MAKPKKSKGRKPCKVEGEKKPHQSRIYKNEKIELGCSIRTVDFDRLDRQ